MSTNRSSLQPRITIAAVILATTLVGSGGYRWYTFYQAHQNKLFPGISINNTPIGSLTQEEAVAFLTYHQTELPNSSLVLRVDETRVATSSTQLKLQRAFSDTVAKAFDLGHTGPWWQRVKEAVTLSFSPTTLTAPLEYDKTELANLISTLKKKIDIEGVRPAASLKTTGSATSLVIEPGSFGRELNATATAELAQNQLYTVTKDTSTLTQSELEITALVASTSTELSPEQVIAARERAAKLVGDTLIFSTENVKLRLGDQDLVKLLAFPDGYADEEISSVMNEWTGLVTREPQDAEFVFDEATFKVTKFTPHLNGLTLDQAKLKAELTAQLALLEEKTEPTTVQAALPVTTKAPAKTLASTNTLGINELIGQGDSEYAHSIPSRVHNVALASQKINTHLIKPGEEFSFNKALGDVSRASGYQPAYVISGGQTILGDGGGVCQVSTTLFRSVLDAGLPVTKRKAHSYRVSYYELDSKPGVDATVYSGDVDLRFKNDTGHHVLIHTQTDSENLKMKVELYGTSDGRTTELTDHVTWGYQPAPASVYIPTPTLPTGRVKQIDWAASGIKAKFKNIVKDKDGNIIREEEYVSNYRPWSAKYLRGI